MIYVYLACLIIGGILLGGSLLLGAMHADADADHDADLGHDVDVGHDLDVEHDADHDAEVDAAGFWLPFLSLRFWIFTSTFFGMTGTLLTVLDVGPVLTAVVSVALGLVCGTTAAYVIHRLAGIESTGDVPTRKEFIGIVGEVLVTIEPGKKGKVRVNVRDHSVDLVAVTSDDEPLPHGSKVLVVEYEDDLATVTAAPLGDEITSD